MCFGGGGERWLFEISRRLSQKGYEVNIISLRYPPNTNRPNFRANNDFHYFELPYVKLPRGNPIPSPSSIRDILKKFNDSDVVYFYVSPPNEIILKIFKSGLRSPIIGGFHSFMWHRITLQRLYSYFMKYLRYVSYDSTTQSS